MNSKQGTGAREQGAGSWELGTARPEPDAFGPIRDHHPVGRSPTGAPASARIPIEVDPTLADAVVLLRPPADYRDAVEPLYAKRGEDRRRAFEEKHVALFRSSGYLAPVERALAGTPDLAARVGRALIAKADQRRDEVVDLAPERLGFRLGMRLRTSRFLDAEGLEAYLRRELELVSEMLDPSFEYDPAALRGSSALDEARRERFALLWSIYAAGRLARRQGSPESRRSRDELPPGFRQDRERLLWAAFPRIPAALRTEVFDRLASPRSRTHGELVTMAEGPGALLRCLGITWAEETRGPIPGARCPLCAFPTHAWAAMPLGATIARAARAQHPRWDPEDGLCERCAEHYAGAFARQAEGAP